MLKFLPKLLRRIKKFHTSYFILRTSQSGQALIILILVMVAALTIGLSVASRTITDIRVSTQSELSQKAFSAAEAGVEDALRRDLSILPAGSVSVGDATYQFETTAQGGGTSFAPDRPIERDDVVQLKTEGCTPSPCTSLTIYWIDKSSTVETSSPASIEIAEVYTDSTACTQTGGVCITKKAYNADCTLSNGFDCGSTNSDLGFEKYSQKATLSLNNTPSRVSKIIRIKPLYNKTSLAVSADKDLPVQSYLVTSTGTSGGITRKVQVTKSVEALSPVFDFGVYSGTDLSK